MNLSFGFYCFKGHEEKEIKYLPNVKSLQIYHPDINWGHQSLYIVQNIETKINVAPLTLLTLREIKGHVPKYRTEEENNSTHNLESQANSCASFQAKFILPY